MTMSKTGQITFLRILDTCSKSLACVAMIICLCCSPTTAAERGITVTPRHKLDQVGLNNYDPEHLHALIFGINDYQNWPDLSAPVNDAKTLEKILRIDYGFRHVELVLDEQANRNNTIKILRRTLQSLTEEDSLLIYLAGHGHLDKLTNEGFWIPYEGSSNTEETPSYISYDTLVNYFEKFKVKHLLVVADSCFSGKMRGQSNHVDTITNPLKKFDKDSRIIMTSGAIEQVADNSGNGHSPYFNRFKQYLEIVSKEKPIFSSADLHGYIENNLTEKTTPTREPLVTDSHMKGGDFVFVRLDFNPENFQTENRPGTGNGQPEGTSSPGNQETASAPLSPLPQPPPSETVGFILSQPQGGNLSINGRSYSLAEEATVYLPQGRHPFSLQLDNSQRTIYGIFDVMIVDKDTTATTFGVGYDEKDTLFKKHHINAALQGRPVRYSIGLDNHIVASYTLSLRRLY